MNPFVTEMMNKDSGKIKEKAMIATDFQYYNPIKIVAGKKALDNITYEMDQLNVYNPLCIIDENSKAAGLDKELVKAFYNSELSIPAIFSVNDKDEDLKTIKELTVEYIQMSCDCIVVMGVGKTVDIAKGISLFITENIRDISELKDETILKASDCPIFLLFNQFCQGEECSDILTLSQGEGKENQCFCFNHLLPKVVFMDSRIHLKQDNSTIALAGVNTLVKALESTYSKKKNPHSDSYSMSSLQYTREYLMRTLSTPSNKEGMSGLINASVFASIGLSNSPESLIGALAKAINKVSQVSTNLSQLALMPAALQWCVKSIEMDWEDVLLPLIGLEAFSQTKSEQHNQTIVSTLQEWQEKISQLTNLPTKLEKSGIKKEDFSAIIDNALAQDAIKNLPNKIKKEDLLSILEESY